MKPSLSAISLLSALSVLAFSPLQAAVSITDPAVGGQPAVPGSISQQSVAPAAGQELKGIEGAKAHYSAGRFAEALKIIEPLAKQKDPEALYLMGLAHENGHGVDASREKALDYYRKATELKHQEARYRIPLLLLVTGNEAERKQARTILEEAAKTEAGIAGRILGEAWLRGMFDGTPDPDQAIKWWGRAVSAGDQPSIMLLAAFYEGQYGFSARKDPAEAVRIYGKGASLGNANAMVTLGSRLLNGDPAVRDEKRAIEWLKKAADLGMPTAYFVLGDHEEGRGKDAAGALKQYEKGVEKGQPDCMVRAAGLYLEGRGTEKNETRALSLLEKAAQQGHIEANFRLGMLKLAAKQPDTGAGYLHLLAAANGNLPQAQNELALIYLSGKLGIADQTAAVGWLTRAAKAGSPHAQHNLGTLYEAGAAGLQADANNARELYGLAAGQGHAAACFALARLISDVRVKPKNTDLAQAWALASLVAEGGDEKAKALVADIETRCPADSLEQARKMLKDLKARFTGGAAPNP